MQDTIHHPGQDSAIGDRADLMGSIVAAGQRAGIIRPDLETASVTECLHILECLAPAAGEADLPRQERGVFSQDRAQPCWEISMAHVCEQSSEWLMTHAGKSTSGLFFDVSKMCDAVFIIKLIASPWSDTILWNIAAMTPADLRQEHKEAGMPEPLINLVHMAAQADARFLVLDSDANPLEGLPVYDW